MRTPPRLTATAKSSQPLAPGASSIASLSQAAILSDPQRHDAHGRKIGPLYGFTGHGLILLYDMSRAARACALKLSPCVLGSNIALTQEIEKCQRGSKRHGKTKTKNPVADRRIAVRPPAPAPRALDVVARATKSSVSGSSKCRVF